MREIPNHHVNAFGDKLLVHAVDAPGAGGASHLYRISGFDPTSNPARDDLPQAAASILFQNGPLSEVGANGITDEALLAILVDRLESFQSGPYSSPDNQEALDALRSAQVALRRRTLERMTRGVEGTSAV